MKHLKKLHILPTWVASSLLLMGIVGGSCNSNEPPQPITPPQPKPDTTKVDTVEQKVVIPQFFMPVMQFNQKLNPDSLTKWQKATGAVLASKTETSYTYTMPQSRFKTVTYLLDNEGIYREAAITVRDHNVIKEDSLLNYLKSQGDTAEYLGLWYSKTNDNLNIDLYEDKEMQDIRVYESERNPQCIVPFVDFGSDISRSQLKKQMSDKGYTFDPNQGNSYNLYFNTGNKHFPRFVIQFDKQTESPRYLMLYTANKYVYRSPQIGEYFLNHGYTKHNAWRRYTPVFINEQGIKVSVKIPSLDSPEIGGILFESTAPIQATITSISFPWFEFGKTPEEVIAYENQQGRKTQWFTDLLNAQTNDPFFLVHAYNFSKETGLSTSVTTVVSQQGIVESKQFIALMKAAGFDYDGVQASGRHTYWHKTQNVVAIVDPKTRRPTITYKPKPNSSAPKRR